MLIESLNIVAWAGWTYIGFLLLTITSSVEDLVEHAFVPTLLLESICWMEVLRIACGNLAGNFTLGFVLHACRTLVLTVVFPTLGSSSITITDPPTSTNLRVLQCIWGSWALTEMTRYPMYILGKSSPPVVRLVRMMVPLVTFPLGAGAEAYGAYLVLKMAHHEYDNNHNRHDDDTHPIQNLSLSLWIQGALVLMMCIQVFLGPTMAYPVIVKKAFQEMGILPKKLHNKTSKALPPQKTE